jgi:SAM-dependent methyltransferase
LDRLRPRRTPHRRGALTQIRESATTILRCPRCRAEGQLELVSAERDQREVRAGTLRCRGCAGEFRVVRGAADLLPDAPDFVLREEAGLERFADTMRADGWDQERILRLPNEPSGYWYAQAVSMQQLLDLVDFRPGQRLLDIGSNTCWASSMFAERGLEVVALDIAFSEMQGLFTADWWFEGNGVYFERIRSLMFDQAVASESMDYVFACEVLHHNDSETLDRTFREIHRVLKPGGKLLIINEQMRFPLELKRDHGQEVAEYEGYEHVFFFHQYWRAARRAGFPRFQVLDPPYDGLFRGDPITLDDGTSGRAAIKLGAIHAARKSDLGRRMYLFYRTLIRGHISLNAILTKPA